MSRIIKSASKPFEIVRKAVTIQTKVKKMTYNEKGGGQHVRDLTLLSPPYEISTLRNMSETSKTLSQCISAYSQNVVGFGIGVRYKVDDKDVTPPMEKEKSELESLVQNWNLERPAKEVLVEAIEQLEECGNAYIEIVRNNKGEVVGIENIEPEYVTVTKINRVTCEDGLVRKFRYFVVRDSTEDATGNGIYFKTYGDPTPLRVDGRIAAEDEGTATEVIHWKIGDQSKPYGVPRYIGALLDMVGDRKASELNYNYFVNGRHTPLAILIENGQLTEESERTLTDHANALGGESSQHKFLLLEAERASATDNAYGDEEKDKVNIKLEKLADVLQKDALFLEYSKDVRETLLSKFRLPPVFVGLSSDYNRSTVETAKELTEEQVFQPMRESFEWRMNNWLIDYDFQHVELFLKSPDLSNTEDLKAILEVANAAGGVAPNDVRDLVGDTIGKILEPFDGDEYNLPLGRVRQQSLNPMASFTGLEKAYGDNSESELAGMLRRALRRSDDG